MGLGRKESIPFASKEYCHSPGGERTTILRSPIPSGAESISDSLSTGTKASLSARLNFPRFASRFSSAGIETFQRIRVSASTWSKRASSLLWWLYWMPQQLFSPESRLEKCGCDFRPVTNSQLERFRIQARIGDYRSHKEGKTRKQIHTH